LAFFTSDYRQVASQFRSIHLYLNVTGLFFNNDEWYKEGNKYILGIMERTRREDQNDIVRTVGTLTSLKHLSISIDLETGSDLNLKKCHWFGGKAITGM